MVPYTLIVTASHRPHLLDPTLQSLLAHVDQPPTEILVHDDDATDLLKPEIGEARRADTRACLTHLMAEADWLEGCPTVYTWASPPRRMGLALRWLLANVRTEYVLYSQDDFVTVRRLPVALALDTLQTHELHQIRFNKRATLAYKETWQGRWEKREVHYGPVTLCVSDHWYFQTGVWRVAPIKAAVEWATATETRRRLLAQASAEEALNLILDGHCGPIAGLSTPLPTWQDPATRQAYQRTFIWGPIGEDRYIRHIGGEDPTGDHPRHGGIDSVAQAWREIASYHQERGREGTE